MHADAMPGNTADGSEIPAARPADDQIAYTVPHAAKVIDLGVRTVWQLVLSGQIKSIKIGRSRRVMRADLVAYVDSLRDAA